MIAQDPTKHPGSIIRIHLDGSIPKDNPKFKGKNDWLPEIFQIGVRNPQGLTLSPFDKKIYMSNHGAKGGDWFGQVKFGENYGWKILGWGGKNYSGTEIGPKWKPGFTKAIYYWVPSIATSAIAIYKGEEFKEWNGHALVTSLKDQSLRKLIFKNVNEVKEDIIFKDKIGRIRDIQIQNNTGKIFMLTDNGSLWKMEKK
jgi:quinoprotein glucose dehydrogenase